jgi:putative DNA methylase
MTVTRKKLIEVALPLVAINNASVREGYIYRGNPSALHKWWAQRPLAAARAVIFAQMVDDPSSFPDLFRSEKAQAKERARLFSIIEDLVKWENTTNEEVLQKARNEIWTSWRRACADNAGHPRAKELFDRHKLPPFHDPFAGSGTLALEAQRLGLEAHAGDLNPVAVLISKAMVEIPPKFAGRPPVNSDALAELARGGRWNGTGAQGLAVDVRYYGKWVRDQAEKRIGQLYPKVPITAEMANDRPDLKPLVGRDLTVIAWLWTRTVKSPNPAFADVQVPLASTFMLSTKAGKEVYVQPVLEHVGTAPTDLAPSRDDLVGRAQLSAGKPGYRLTVKVGKPKDPEAAKLGTSAGKRSAFRCLMSGVPVSYDHIRCEGKAGRIGNRLMAIVAETDRRRVYLPPSEEQEVLALTAKPEWKPDAVMPKKHRNFQPPAYGMDSLGDIFTRRQLVALTTISDLVGEAMTCIRGDAIAAGLSDDNVSLCNGGMGARAYSEAVGVYLAFAADKTTEYGCTIVPWYSKEDRPKGLFARHAIPMVWDYAEVNPLCDIGGTYSASVEIIAGALSGCAADGRPATSSQIDAVSSDVAEGTIISTDPPYYDNIAYADLSDFFYVWLRRTLRTVFPDLFATLAVPKATELVASPSRHGGREQAEAFFLDGMTRAMHRLAEQAHPAMPVTIYYAFKQAETASDAGTTSTGWETFLDAVGQAGLSISGTWPMRTERGARAIGMGFNALASSIVLVCRPRPADAPIATRREFVAALKTELPAALRHLQAGNIAPVDLAQAAIGPGMGVYTRYARVLDAEGKPVPVREALALINATLDEALAEQEGDFDADSRWALAWFEQNGFAEGEYGVAETLSKAKNTSVSGLAEAGILVSRRGKVRLLKPEEFSPGWDPATDPRLSAWEVVHQLIRALGAGGEAAAADLVAKLGARAEAARELAYRLYTLCERKKRAAEAVAYNSLVQSWPEIARLAADARGQAPLQPAML